MNEDTDLQALVTILQGACSNTESPNWVEIPPAAAAGILAILRGLPNSTPKGRPAEWTYFDERHALEALMDGREVNGLAREMARRTGQLAISAGRRLKDMKRHMKELDMIGWKFTTGRAGRGGCKNS